VVSYEGVASLAIVRWLAISQTATQRLYEIRRAYHVCKFFTYVTKTCAKLTTYSRKLENYNGIIIFEIDIMRKSSQINLYFCQTGLFDKFFGRFFCFDLL
jgi:hypothetical protein